MDVGVRIRIGVQAVGQLSGWDVRPGSELGQGSGFRVQGQGRSWEWVQGRRKKVGALVEATQPLIPGVRSGIGVQADTCILCESGGQRKWQQVDRQRETALRL